MSFDLNAYFARIGADGPGTSTEETLREVQAAQLRAIAFENVDAFLGRTPDLAPDALWRKLILEGRGGYCFELNGLLGQALIALGFELRPVLARVRMGAPAGGPRSHLGFLVSAGQNRWLVDAGFGGPGPLEPLQLGSDTPQQVGGVGFRLRPDPESGETVLERQARTGWFSLYGFDEVPVRDVDVAVANFAAARWEGSRFPSNLMVNLYCKDGRISLLNTALKIDRGGAAEERVLDSRSALADALTGLFKLRYGDDTVAALWTRLERIEPKAAA